MKKPLLYHEVHGEGEPVILLRGLGRCIEHWNGFHLELAKYFKVIVIENRGIGKSAYELGLNCSIHDFAQDVVDVLDHLNIPKAHMAGVSLGGMICLSLGLNFEQRCLSLCAINSSVGYSFSRLSLSGLRSFIKVAKNPKAAEKVLVDVLIDKSHSKNVRNDIAKKWQKIREENPPNLKNVILQLVAASKFAPLKKLNAIKSPTLIVVGENDLLVPIKNSFKIHQNIPRSTLSMIRGAGHELMVDKPEEFINIYKKFIQNHSIS